MRIEIQVFVIILIDMQISLQLYEIISTNALDENYTLCTLLMKYIALINYSQMPMTK